MPELFAHRLSHEFRRLFYQPSSRGLELVLPAWRIPNPQPLCGDSISCTQAAVL